MAKEQYFVVFHENQWKIKHNDRHWDVVRPRSKGTTRESSFRGQNYV
jgi:hypothetical protein